jgi:hypothetical protein
MAIVAEVTDLADCPDAAPHAGEVAWFGGFLLIAAAAYSANAQPGEEDGQARPGVKEQGVAALHSGQAWAPGRRRRSAHRSRAAGVPDQATQQGPEENRARSSQCASPSVGSLWANSLPRTDIS